MGPKNSHHKHHQREERNDDVMENKHNNVTDELRLNTHTTRETKTTHHQQYEDDAKTLSPTLKSSRSHSDKNAILSMNMAYDSGGSTTFVDKFSIFFLTNFIALFSCFISGS